MCCFKFSNCWTAAAGSESAHPAALTSPSLHLLVSGLQQPDPTHCKKAAEESTGWAPTRFSTLVTMRGSPSVRRFVCTGSILRHVITTATKRIFLPSWISSTKLEASELWVSSVNAFVAKIKRTNIWNNKLNHIRAERWSRHVNWRNVRFRIRQTRRRVFSTSDRGSRRAQAVNMANGRARCYDSSNSRLKWEERKKEKAV